VNIAIIILLIIMGLSAGSFKKSDPGGEKQLSGSYTPQLSQYWAQNTGTKPMESPANIGARYDTTLNVWEKVKPGHYFNMLWNGVTYTFYMYPTGSNYSNVEPFQPQGYEVA